MSWVVARNDRAVHDLLGAYVDAGWEKLNGNECEAEAAPSQRCHSVANLGQVAGVLHALATQ